MNELTNEETAARDMELEDIWSEIYESQAKHNAEVARSNQRILRIVKKRLGVAFSRHLLTFLKENEAEGYMGYDHKWELSRTKGKHDCTTNEYGRKLRSYSVDQYAQGTEGDSWHGYIYIELRAGLYLKVPFND